MPAQLKVQLVSVAEDGSESTEDLLVLTKQHERVEQLGLTLAESKQLLREVQRRVVQQQATAFLATQTACPTCGRQRNIKDHKLLGLRMLVRQDQLG
jgi:DNA repair exonuclease SbcCD ATPase subunit